MTHSVWSKGMFSSRCVCADNCAVERLSSFQSDLTLLNSHESGFSVIPHKNREMLPERQIYSSGKTSGLLCSNQISSSLNSSGHTFRRNRSPALYGHHDWSLTTGHQAKRARVENIIKGMIGSDQHTHEDEANQEVTMSGFEDTKLERTRKDFERQHQHLRQLRNEVCNIDRGNDCPNVGRDEEYPSWGNTSETFPDDEFTESCNLFESSSDQKSQGWKKVKLLNYFQSKPERIKLMADVLKCELSRAVSKSIDSIFKSMPLLQTSDEEDSVTAAPLQLSENQLRFSYRGTPDGQTEALSLVKQKPETERPGPSPPLQQNSPITVHYNSDQTPESCPRVDYQRSFRCFQDGEVDRSKFHTLWNSTKVKSKVNSRPARSPQSQTLSMDPSTLESLYLPHVKIESDGLVKSNQYMLNEGLTTNHLKKAKLMFFYTRYPSSLVLKMCFNDVQFTRCITSQLIKWFSNFREFYYIQMEKFARSALMQGVVDMRHLTVDRESELFRALNMHYNKANDYQVPERFLEVAEVTLREFYIAISTGKDRDPSWKKAIYKVICKLDCDVPTDFKIHHSA